MKGAYEEHQRAESVLDHPARWAGYLPEAPALTFGEERWDYATLDRRAQRTAVFLTDELGLRRGDRVGILAANHPFFFELAFACFRTGLVLAPFNWRLAPREIGALVELSGPGVLFADRTGADLLDRVPGGVTTGVLDIETYCAQPPRALEPATLHRGTELEEPALILFTSGTTGLPKAAVLPARQLFYNALNTQTAFGLTSADSTVLYTPLFHTGAINVLAMPLLQCGGQVHIHERFEAEAIWETVAQESVTTLFGVPTTFATMAAVPTFAQAGRSTLRLCLCGGAPLPVSFIRQYEEAGILLTQGFGMTEVGPNCFFLPPTQALARAGSVGKPIHYCRVRVMADGHAVRAGEVGELQFQGPTVFLGYFRNAEATAQAFTDDGWFRTGDLVRQDRDGYTTVAGRRKEMFISGGENVYPAEVENALSGLEGIAESAVVPLPDERWGEVGCAWVVCPDGRWTGPELARQLRTLLAPYKIPKRFLFVDELPRTASGKVAKRQLMEEAKSHAA